ncbi:hypothetical protein HPL003_26435 [Paenibacillus terrae HPL-003]|uniref:CYTH domain-containing protein n=1 Tax=Paenibacillus terrae (strain HPL-003) TaxID=985665 RepID=G7VRA2_PAETH|nr:CYTH domain-containing protein [Paenibacillus terrae]AET62001.1 hypothetical protein HPL003_26435 [Paenibacillus terrae HPL-003]
MTTLEGTKEKMKKIGYSIREKLIIENELKFEISEKKMFKPIYDYLKESYVVVPYRNAHMYDFYYDTQDLDLSKAGITYRVRYRPQISINLKLPQTITNRTWSRYEYSCKVDGKLPKNMSTFDVDCDIHRIAKKFLGVTNLSELKNISIVSSFRTGFILRFPRINVLGENEFLGVAFFDQSADKINNKSFYEFELESFQQSDVFASPYIFNEFDEIGKFVESLGHSLSSKSKKEKCMNL